MDVQHPKAFPLEFRRNVVAVARKNEAPIARVAKDFEGIFVGHNRIISKKENGTKLGTVHSSHHGRIRS